MLESLDNKRHRKHVERLFLVPSYLNNSIEERIGKKFLPQKRNIRRLETLSISLSDGN